MLHFNSQRQGNMAHLLHSCGPGGSIRGVVPVLVVLIVQAGLCARQDTRW